MSDAPRYRLDDVRRFASALAVGSGVAPARASSLATHLLWFDAAGASSFGIATLPHVLDRIEAGAIDPAAEGTFVRERSATAVFDGRKGLPLLALERAGGVATEKARDTGLGLVQVENLEAPPSTAGVAAEMAVGPVAALILGPGPSWSVAVPSEGGLPAVFDPSLGVRAGGSPSRKKEPAAGTDPARRAVEALIGPWAAVLAPRGGWLVAAISVPALEPLPDFHRRAAAALGGLEEGAGRLLPAPWEDRRREVRGHGLAVDPAAWNELTRRARGLGVAPPAPLPS